MTVTVRPYHPTIDADNGKTTLRFILLLQQQHRIHFHILILYPSGSVSPFQNSSESIHQSAVAEYLILALNDVASSSYQRQSGGWTSSEDEVDHDEVLNLKFQNITLFPLHRLFSDLNTNRSDL